MTENAEGRMCIRLGCPLRGEMTQEERCQSCNHFTEPWREQPRAESALGTVPVGIGAPGGPARVNRPGRRSTLKTLRYIRLGFVLILIVGGLIVAQIAKSDARKGAQPINAGSTGTTAVTPVAPVAQPTTQATQATQATSINQVVALPPVDTSSNSAIFLRVMTIHHEAMCTGNTWLLQQAWGPNPSAPEGISADSWESDTQALNRYGSDCLKFDDPSRISIVQALVFSDKIHMQVQYSFVGGGRMIATLLLVQQNWYLDYLTVSP